MSQELNIAQSTVYHWRKEFCSIETPQHTYTPKEFDAISRKLEKLEHEKEIIQLSGFLEKVPLKTKLATLEKLYKTEENPYSVYELCEALGVARGTFYNHIFRRADRSEYDREQEALMLKVQQIRVCKSFFSKVLKLLAFQGVWMFLYSRFPLFFPLSGKNKGKSYCTLSSSFAASRLASLLACA